MDIGDKILHSINLLGDLPVFPTRIFINFIAEFLWILWTGSQPSMI